MERISAGRLIDEIRIAAKWTLHADMKTHEVILEAIDDFDVTEYYVGPRPSSMSHAEYRSFLSDLDRTIQTAEIKVNRKVLRCNVLSEFPLPERHP